MVLLMTNVCCLGCSPGALTRFLLQSGKGLGAAGWGQIGSKYVCGHVPMRVKHLPSFCSIFPMTTAANNLLTLGYAAGPLGEVLDLI